MEISLALAFVSGVIVGISPCILLMLSTFGSSLALSEEKAKFLRISIGLLSGMILMYILLSILLLFFVRMFEALYFLKYVFAAILIAIGVWQIVECRKEQSTIFGTPEKVKTVLKEFIDKNSGFYAFLVGIIFVLIKIPCFGSVYLALVYSVRNSPTIYVFIAVYLIGMMLPIILVLIFLRIGLESMKLNDFRLKYRTLLRLLSGCVLIFLAFYLLVLDDWLSGLN